MIKFWWRSQSPSGYRDFFQIYYYSKIWKVVINGHKSVAHNDAPDGDTSKTCLGGGMYCPSASSYYCYNYIAKT